MVGIGEDSSDERQGRQERRRWRIRHIASLLSLPGNTILNGGMAGSITRLGVGASAVLGAQRRSLLLGGVLLLAMMTALVVAQFAGPQGQSGPSPAFAQTCAVPTITLTGGGGSLTIAFDRTGVATPEKYRYRYKKSAENLLASWSSWIDVNIVGGVYQVETIVTPLPFEVRHDVQARAVCASNIESSSVAKNVITGIITRSFDITLTQNGQAITEIPEGESATLTVTLDPADTAFDAPTNLVVGFLFSGDFSGATPIPGIEIGEALVSSPPDNVQGELTAIQTLVAGERSVSFTVTAVQDNLEHDTAPDDNEHPLEASLIAIVYPSEPSEQIRVGGSLDWHYYIYIRDGIPPVPTPSPTVTPVATVTPMAHCYFDSDGYQ